MKIYPLKQRDESACGPTAIEMVLKYFNIKHSYKEIATISKYKAKGGLYNKDMVDVFKSFGLIVKEKNNTRWNELMRANTNDYVIVMSWMMKGYIGHFSVVEKVGKNFIELADPYSGNITKMERIMFMRLWMDYDDMWYPVKNTDIQLRWMCVASKKKIRSR